MLKKKIKQLIGRYSSIALSPNYLAEDNLFKDKVVVITGGTGDMGKAITKRFLDSGAKVVAIGRDTEKLNQIHNENVKTVKWNLTDMSDVQGKISEIASCFGKIDIWVNNAGVVMKKELAGHGTFFDVDQDDWENTFNINAKALYFITQGICKYYVDNNIKGHVVQVLSIEGIFTNWRIYGLSKRMGIGLTQGIAKEVAPYGIIVNGVCPGGCATQMAAPVMTDINNLRAGGPSGRFCTPEEIAYVVWFLASDMAMQHIGTIYTCDGGDSMR